MRKIGKVALVVVACVVGIVLLCVVASICSCVSDCKSRSKEVQTYTIQYTDSAGVHMITVTAGSLYSIDPIPEKFGYEFLGLFDAEVGGTQYISAGGSSLAAFTDNKNLVLYPQFKAKEFTLILDYQGADVTGSRSLTVAYNSEIGELPLNLTLENKTFTGWYTAPDRQGRQIADAQSVLPENRKVTEKVFDLSDPDGNIKLYAGFQWVEYTLTFYFEDGGKPREIKASHGADFDTVKPNIVVNNKMVVAWSRKKNDVDKAQIFSGEITDDVILYAAEYAPFVEFDANGGDAVASIMARTGDTVRLPLPTKAHYKFLGWQDTSGDLITSVVMPENSMRLVAQWQAMIEFDSNGGAAVGSISQPQGTAIELPETTRAGYLFAGWYSADGAKYEKTGMPSESIQLLAKYYKIENKKVVVIREGSVQGNGYNAESPSMAKDAYFAVIDLDDIYNKGIRNVHIRVHYQTRYAGSVGSSGYYTYVGWYGEPTASTATQIMETSSELHLVANQSEWKTQTFEKEISLTSGKIYACFYNTNSGISIYYSYGQWTDFWVEIAYPDRSTLY